MKAVALILAFIASTALADPVRVNGKTCSGTDKFSALTVTNGVGTFACSADSGGGGGVTVEEADGAPTVAADTIEFDQADGFAVTDEGSGDVQVDLTLAGDVDGSGGATDLDEAAVETELESVLDLADMQGSVGVTKGGTGVTTIADDQVVVGTGADTTAAKTLPDCDADNQTLQYDQTTSAWICGDDDTSAGGYATIRDNGSAETQRTQLNILSGLNMSATCADDAVTPETDCTFATSATPSFTGATISNNGSLLLKEATGNGTDHIALQSPAALASPITITFPEIVAPGLLRTDASGNLSVRDDIYFDVLSTPATCAVSASYCNIFAYTPGASRGVRLTARIIVDSDSTTVAPQFRVSSADTGYTGICHWVLWDKATGTTTAPAYVNTAIGTAPADTASTAWPSTANTIVEVECGLQADASPGVINVEWQLETGTSPLQVVRDGSYLVVGQY